MSKHEHIILFLLQAGLFSLLWKIRPEMENSKSSTDNFKGLKKYLTCRQEGEKKKKSARKSGTGAATAPVHKHHKNSGCVESRASPKTLSGKAL